MCGRYSQTASAKELRERFQFAAANHFDLKPRYNIAPSQDAPVIVDEGGRALKQFRWGLIPSWAKEAAIGYKMINARAETLTEKPSFKKPFHTQRCLIIADGF
jgi:putative SOS response-associated peptidase YedK